MKLNHKLSFLTVIMVLLLVLSAFVACDSESDDSTNTSDTTVGDDTTAPVVENLPLDISLSEYNLVYPVAWTEKAAIDSFKKSYEGVTGGFLPASTDQVQGGVITDAITATKEILIGQTNRPESAAALENAPDNTYVIAVIGNKIVINSTVTDFVIDGMNYFVKNYLSASVNGVLSLTTNHKYTSDPNADIAVISNGKSNFKIVYRAGLDADDAGSGVDVEVKYAQTLKTAMTNNLKTKVTMVDADNNTSSREILIGNVDRAERLTFLSGLNYDQYGFAVVGNKIVVAGWNYVTTQQAVTRFATYVKSNAQKNADGTYSLVLPLNFKEVFTHKTSEWELDIPAYEGGIVKGTNPSADGFLTQITDTTIAEYDAYCAKLASSGYTLTTSNEIELKSPSAEGKNKFALYTGSKNNVYVYYADAFKSVRIIAANNDVKYPEYFTKESVPAYIKIATSTVTQMELDYDAKSFGMCYIILLEDGTFLVFDGGLGYGNDAAKLYDTLKKLNPRTDGKIVISGWFLTHEHRDHFNNFEKFCNTYGNKGNKVQVKAAYVNFNDECMWGNITNTSAHFLSDSGKYNAMSKAVGGMEIITVRTGMEFYICNAKIEILYTEEDIYPHQLNNFNDTSTVSRVTISDQSIIFLGDVRYVGSDIMSAMYGRSVKADIVQVSHHGWDGGTLELYKLINPMACFWPGDKYDYAGAKGAADSNVRDVAKWLTSKCGSKLWLQTQTTTLTFPYKNGDKVVES